MLQSYIRIAWRNLYRYPGYSFITVVGLAVGIAGCLFVLLYLQDEMSFDRFNEQSDRTYRVVEVRPTPDQGNQRFAYTAGILAPTLAAEVPEVDKSIRLIGSYGVGRRTVSHGDRRFYEGEYLFAEPGIFDVFDLDLIDGNPESALSAPNTAVLTRSSAMKYFGPVDPVGKTFSMEQFGDVTVTGVIDNPPINSHLHFSMLISYATTQVNDDWARWLNSWDNTAFIVYAVLRKDADPTQTDQKIAALLQSHLGSEPGVRAAYLQPVADIHFGSGAIGDERNAHEGDPRYIYIFSAIGAFLILIASINYMNMTTARSMRRAREIGMRKVSGGHRGQLVRQFLCESLLTTIFAILIALVLVSIGLPWFNEIAGKSLAPSSILDGQFVAGLVVLALTVGLVAGSYPALFLSRFKPVQILSGNAERTGGAARLRRALVIAQFALSVIMIVATTVVYRQMQFVQTAPLGFDSDRLVVVDINNGDVRRDWRTVRSEFAKVPMVQSVSTSSRVPGDWKGIAEVEVRPEGASDDGLITMHYIGIDDAFLSTFGIHLLQGRDFSPAHSDSTSVLLNETAAKMLGIPNAANQTVEVPEVGFKADVIGIVKDFNFKSLHQKIGPVVLGYWSNPVTVIDYFTARVSSDNLPSIIGGLREVGERFDPSHPFEYNVLDQRLQDFYVADRRAGRLFGLAAALAILIACLGLAGLAAYTAERRTKEIGVRKVLGATVQNIVLLLSMDFVILVLVAFVIAGPLAYLAMDRWLDAFAYRTELSVPIFVLSGAVALLVAILTVSIQAIRSAVADPVRSLRYE